MHGLLIGLGLLALVILIVFLVLAFWILNDPNTYR